MMTKQSTSIDDRRQKIMEVAATQYHSGDDTAKSYLSAIEGADLDGQKQLFRLILTVHNTRLKKQQRDPLDNTLDFEKWKPIADRMIHMVKGWSKAAVRNNAPLDETADMLWNELTLREAGNDRVVALDLLLNTDAVPYAQLPGSLTLMKPLDVYGDAHDRILDKLAMFHRLEKSEDTSSREIAFAMTVILEQLEDKDERVAFLTDFVSKVSHKLNRADMAESVLSLLGSAVLEPFGFGHPGHDHDDQKKHDD